MSVREAVVNGIRMRWQEHGDGPSVVFIHGIPTSPLLWRYVLPLLRDARTLAWEMVGYGDSIPEGRDRDISVARQAEYLSSWMEEVGIDDAILVGHDLGGGVAQIVAVRNPERVRGLVLINSISYDTWPIPSVKILRALAPVVRNLPDALTSLILGVIFARGHREADRAREALSVHFQFYREHGASEAFTRQILALDVHDTIAISDRLGSVDVPTRIVWGAADPFQKLPNGQRLAADLSAPIDVIAGARHFVPEDQPQRVADAVMHLIDAGRFPPA